MGYTRYDGEFQSPSGKRNVHYSVFTPDAVPSAIIQISHGFFEHIGRYEKNGFVSAMTDCGYIVCGNDRVWQGEPDTDISEYLEASENITGDMSALNEVMKRTYRSLPYILLGVGAGSYAARKYAVEYQNIDGLILVGTSAGNRPVGQKNLLASVISTFRGKSYKSEMLKNSLIGGYNSRFSGEKSSFSFISDEALVREEYENDGLCKYTPTVASVKCLIDLLSEVSSESWAGKLQLSLPVFIASGEKDPVGDDGEGIKELYSRLEDVELTELSMKLYEGRRHDILSGSRKSEVFSDIAEWVKNTAEGVILCRNYDAVPFGRVNFD